MIRLLGEAKVYTVPEIDAIIRKRTGFQIVNALPDIRLANDRIVYFVRTGETAPGWNDEMYPVLQPYVVGYDDAGGGGCCCCDCPPSCCGGEGTSGGERVWYTTGIPNSAISFEQLRDLPSINGELFIGDMDEAKARAAVSSSGKEGGYNLSIPDADITEVVRAALEGE